MAGRAKEATGPTRAGSAILDFGDASVAKRIDDYLRSIGSPMAGQGSAIVRSARAQGVDPDVIVSLAVAETGAGKNANTRDLAGHNVWGMGGGPATRKSYPNWSAAFADVALTMKNLGLRSATDIPTQGYKWVIGPNATDDARKKWQQSESGKNWVKAQLDYINSQPGREVGISQPADSEGWGDFISNLGSPLDVLKGLVSNIGWIIDPHNWVRLGSMVVGVLGMAVGAMFFLRAQGGAGYMLGLLLVGMGLLWLWGGLKDQNPIEELKASFGG